MKIQRVENQGLRLSGLLPGDLSLLEQIPVHAETTGAPEAEERLFPDPIREEETARSQQANDDWRDHVVPDLRQEFSRQLDVVSQDVKAAVRHSGKSGIRYSLTIPFDHVEAWYGALNQARLVMQTRYEFPENESVASLQKLLESPNLKPFLTSRFYVQLQSALIDLAMDVED